MIPSKKNFGYLLLFAAVAVFGDCTKKEVETKEPTAFYDENGNHESPHPHQPDVGKSKLDLDKDVRRVRDSSELKRMKDYLAGYVGPDEIVTTIKLPSGDICDCLSIEKQPALKRQELKGHKIRFEPPGGPKELQSRELLPGEVDPANAKQLVDPKQEYGQKEMICPQNTIPVLRLTLNILDNFETLEDFFRARRPHDLNGPTNEHQYATARAYGDNWGGQSTLNVWPPYTEKSSEFSLSQITVARGSEKDKQTVEVGWQQYKDLYDDYRPRLFIYFTPDGYGSGGCYNLTCRAFVQVDNRVFIAGGFTNISNHPHPSESWEFTIRWQRHERTGDWWLKYGDIWVGYYPAELFDNEGLGPRAGHVSFYGEIIDDRTEGRHTRTDMGSGHFPADGFGYAAYQRRIRTITTDVVWNINPTVTVSRTDADCYDIALHTSSGDWETYFYFGGPGYNAHCK